MIGDLGLLAVELASCFISLQMKLVPEMILPQALQKQSFSFAVAWATPICLKPNYSKCNEGKS